LSDPDQRAQLGARLRDLRSARLLTQKELAEKAGVRWQTISDIESGRNAPRFTTIRALAKALEVDPSKLTGREVK
jgi:transcriptional regulator with XRE-family HTH domain